MSSVYAKEPITSLQSAFPHSRVLLNYRMHVHIYTHALYFAWKDQKHR